MGVKMDGKYAAEAERRIALVYRYYQFIIKNSKKSGDGCIKLTTI